MRALAYLTFIWFIISFIYYIFTDSIIALKLFLGLFVGIFFTITATIDSRVDDLGEYVKNLYNAKPQQNIWSKSDETKTKN